MKKIRSVILVFAPVVIGAIAFACGSYPFPTDPNAACANPGGAATETCTPDDSITGDLPCDVLARNCHPCVTAHSTIRRLSSKYSSSAPLYTVCKGTAEAGPNSCKGESHDIGQLADGYANAADQDSFCTGAVCFITKIYDQSGNQNDLEPSPLGGNKPSPDNPAKATDLKITANGHTVYGIRIRPGMGYRTGCNDCNKKKGINIPLGDDPETEYMVTSQKNLVNGCCFDYGNAETTSHDDGNGTMEAVYFGGGVIWGTGTGGDPGPWAMADLENGVYAGWENKQDQNISTNTPLLYEYVSDIIVGDTREKNCGKGRFAIYGGDATTGSVKTLWDGVRPEKPGYVPMAKQGSLILGTGGDNTAAGAGHFFEGVMATGAATKDTIDKLQQAIVAAKYGQ